MNDVENRGMNDVERRREGRMEGASESEEGECHAIEVPDCGVKRGGHNSTQKHVLTC